jgi:uncharacterized protein (TIGR03083 family)
VSRGPIEALRTERDVLLKVCAGLTEKEWASPSGCPGWSVKDLVAHLGILYWAVVDPSTLPESGGFPTEEAQDVYVRGRGSASAAEVLTDYESVSKQALDVLAGFEHAEFVVPLGDLGTYQASLLPTAFCFDHYTHIRADLFAPRGPITGAVPASDSLRLTPTLDWIEAALPQQNSKTLASLSFPAEIEITGTASRTIRLGGTGEPGASIRSDAFSLVLWVTQRASWEEVGAAATGHGHDLALVRELRVF